MTAKDIRDKVGKLIDGNYIKTNIITHKFGASITLKYDDIVFKVLYSDKEQVLYVSETQSGLYAAKFIKALYELDGVKRINGNTSLKECFDKDIIVVRELNEKECNALISNIINSTMKLVIIVSKEFNTLNNHIRFQQDRNRSNFVISKSNLIR